jgi:hypothetical protein
MTVSTKRTPIPPNPADYTPDSMKKLLKTNTFDKYLAYSIVKELVLNWEETKAYRLGLVDEKGRVLRKISQLSTEERKQYGLFDNLITNIKRLILRHNKNSLYTWANALRLIREDVNAGDEGNMDVYIRAVTEMVEHEEKLLEDMGAGAVTGSAPSVTTTATGVDKHIVVRHKSGAVFRRNNKKKKKKKGKMNESSDMVDWYIEQYARENPTHFIMVQDEDGRRSFVKYGA